MCPIEQRQQEAVISSNRSDSGSEFFEAGRGVPYHLLLLLERELEVVQLQGVERPRGSQGRRLVVQHQIGKPSTVQHPCSRGLQRKENNALSHQMTRIDDDEGWEGGGSSCRRGGGQRGGR